MATQRGNTNEVSPPYVPWGMLITFLTGLKKTVIPPRIDNTLLAGKSGSDKSQLKAALRFFGAIDQNGSVLPPLHQIVGALQSNEWPLVLAGLMERSYADVVGDVDLATATPGQLEERFRAKGLTGITVTRAIRFYLAGLREAGIKYSPHFEVKKTAASTGAVKIKRKRARKPDEEHSGTPPPKHDQVPLTFADKILQKLPDFDPAWDAKLQEQWFEAVQKVMTMAGPK